jgi:beta-phosphoglucomutase
MTTFGILWDMDGTLVDTAELHFQAWSDWAAEVRQPFDRDDFAATFGKRNPEILDQLYPGAYDAAAIARHGQRKEQLYRSAAEQAGVNLLPGVRTLLDGLRDLGARQAVASSAPRPNLDLIVRLTGTIDHFHTLVSAEDVQHGKPNPEVFLLAAERVGLDPSVCVVVEDAVAGVEAARAGGMRCIAVTFVGHHPAETLRDAGADLVVDSLEQVTVADVRRLLA